MLVWLLAAAAATAVFVLAIRRWSRSLRRRARKPAPPRYPVVLAHGFMGFDEIGLGPRKHLYFRGIGAHLESMGALVYSPRVPPASTIAVRARRLADLIRALPDPRVNIVAHSMGGLDARYAISQLGLAPRVASLTTIGTPHLGTPLANAGNALFGAVSRMLRRFFFDLVAFGDLTTGGMARFNASVPDAGGVAYASVVGRSERLGTNPLLWPSHLYLAERSGPNDGVVPAASQSWGEVIREVDADHWAQIGWSLSFDAPAMYEELLRELRGRGF